MENPRQAYSKSYIETIDGIDFLYLNEGDRYHTGYVAGKLFLDTKNGLIAFLKNPIILVALRILYFFKKRRIAGITVPEQYREELYGMSDGTLIPYRCLLLVNLIYELRGCSGFAFFDKDGALIVGHNTDTAAFLARLLLKKTRPLVTRVSIPSTNTFVHVSLPGFIGAMNGYNDRGIALSSHDAGNVYPKVVPGNMSASCLLRLMLEQAKNVDDVARITRDHLSYIPVIGLIASEREKKMMFVELYPTESYTRVLDQACAQAANHYMTDHMQKYHKNITKGSRQRLLCLQACFSGGGVGTVADAIAILQDHRNGIRRDTMGYSIANEGTFQSFVFEVTRGALHISNGSKTPVPLHGAYVCIFGDRQGRGREQTGNV